MTDKNQQLNSQKLTQSHSSFLRRNWLTIIACLLGIGFSYYFYQLSKSEREPIFLIDPIRAPIIDSKTFPKTALRVVKGENTPIDGDITSIRFYFWNNGKEPIRKEHILSPILVSLSDKRGEILNYKLLSQSRPEVINATVERYDPDLKTSLKISFRILEKNDGFTGQVLYSGDPNANLIIKGVIEGVKEIGTNPSLLKVRFYKHVLLNLVLPLLLITIFVITPIWLLVFRKAARESFENVLEAFADKILDRAFSKVGRIPPKIGRLLVIVIPIVILFIIGLLVMKYEPQLSQEEVNKSLTRVVPSEIMP